MKYVNFDRVTLKNFLSVGETPVSVEFNKGLNIITGMNRDKLDRRNGVGKSTVADGVYFAIFGSTLRELRKEHIVNNVTQRNCEAILEFRVNIDGMTNKYKIVRNLAPSKCFLYKDGEDITRDSIQNTTSYICKLLHTTPEVFQNCVIMTVNNAIPFMAKKKLDKRKFIEGIFNLQVFSNMLTTARAEYNNISKELDIECAKYEEISNSIDTLNVQKQNINNDKIRSKKKLQARLETCQLTIDNIDDKIKAVDEIDINGISTNINKINKLIDQTKDKQEKLTYNQSKTKALIDLNEGRHKKMSTSHDKCPVCLSELDDTHKGVIEDEKNKIKLIVSELQEKYSDIAKKKSTADKLYGDLISRRNGLTDKLNEANVRKQNIQNYKQQKQQLDSQKRDITDDINSLDKEDTSIDRNIEEVEKRLVKTQKSIDNIKRELAKLEIIKFVVSEEGVKSYIVKKILQLLNSKLSHYLKKMDSNCICVFNEYFEEEIIDEKGKQCSYFNFSGAERKNIDLACLFAFMDIRRLQGDVAFNFSMYDELFDSSLDERGVELVIDILKEKIEKHDECAMVISHRKESTKLATGEVIFLEKQNGITTRVETPETELK